MYFYNYNYIAVTEVQFHCLLLKIWKIFVIAVVVINILISQSRLNIILCFVFYVL